MVQMGCRAEDREERRGPCGGRSPLEENVLLGPPGPPGCSWTGRGTPPTPLSSFLTPVVVAPLRMKGSQCRQAGF